MKNTIQSLFVKMAPLLKALLITEIIFCSVLALFLVFVDSYRLSQIVSRAEINIPRLIVLSILSLIILRWYKFTSQSIKFERQIQKSVNLALLLAIPLILLGLFFWGAGRGEYNTVLDAAYLGDGLFKLGSPLTCYMIELKIFLFTMLELNDSNYFFSLLQVILTPLLFVAQGCIYSIGIFLAIFEFGIMKRSFLSLKN